ncbi:glycosyltransferase family 4 protein [Halorussus gelatinilyticus]|uniref:Glycosyltransferase family 4 protein n=1 Tax=Halorussus gelatinilyticus TaxID=2937524 RepID=A0A8U0IKU1_9EURY|nr:glycosyltransferase family 4 protein [Halorussus gelatinilyticus]UPW01296.1 glycosyltransferase family 4 protein [Halorussus gelatinilyticus]
MLVNGDEGNVGGAQLQQILIAKELVERGHDVVFVENDAPEKTEQTVDGIRVVLKRDFGDSNVAVRTTVRAVETIQALRRVGPDVCYLRVLNFDLLPLTVYCSVTGTRLVYGFAHDSEVTDDPVTLGQWANYETYKRLVWRALSRADALIAQNERQRSAAVRRFGPDVSLVPNGYPIPDETPHADIRRADRPVVLWVATLRDWKRPGLVLDLADEIPDADFVIVGGRADENPDLYDEIEREAGERDNVRFEGFVPYAEVDSYFAAADVFLNTSTDEGFPNTFLQAWAHRTPVASLNVDPSGILADSEAGFCADDEFDVLVEILNSLITDAEWRADYSDAAFEYFRENHSIDHIASKYEGILTGKGRK